MSLPYDPYKPPAVSLDAPPAPDPPAPVPASVVALLAQTRPWVKLLAVLFFVGLGCGVTIALVALSTSFGSREGRSILMSFVPMMIVLLFYIPPALHLWHYAKRIRALQDGGGLPALEEALASQKSFWKYMGVLAAVMLCLYAVVFVAAGMMGVSLRR
jgi:hypothetical protein